jgi:dolichol-phosphate mannosyltransferase
MSAELAVVIPARDEEDNVGPLLDELGAALAGIDFEAIVVDDGSKDATRARLEGAARSRPWVRVLAHERSLGISAALRTGILASTASFVATLDADLQNDPSDLPGLLALARRGEADLVQGHRTSRRDGLVRRVESAIGRAARRVLLGDPTADTGCATRVMTARLARTLPLDTPGMHRFIPAYARLAGMRVVEVAVNHRLRRSGSSKILPLVRGVSGLAGCLALRRLAKRGAIRA